MATGNITATDSDFRTAMALNISVEDAKAINSGEKKFSDLPSEEPADFDEFYDARAQASMYQAMHERGSF